MRTAILTALAAAAVANPALAGNFTFKSCSPETRMSVNSFNSNDPVKMISASSARNVLENDQVALSCATDKCLVTVTTEFLAEDRNRVQHTIDDFVPDGGSVCFRIRASSWNTPNMRVSYGQCSC